MHNIIWQHPDGSLAITHLAPETEARMALAQAMPLPRERAVLEAERERVADDPVACEAVLRELECLDTIERFGRDSAGHAAILIANGSIDLPLAACDVDLPPDQDADFRPAWRFDGAVRRVVVAIEPAREVCRDQIRRARKPLLEALDVEQIRALGRGDQAEVARVETRKQALRDLPQDSRIAAAETLDELRAIARGVA